MVPLTPKMVVQMARKELAAMIILLMAVGIIIVAAIGCAKPAETSAIGHMGHGIHHQTICVEGNTFVVFVGRGVVDAEPILQYDGRPKTCNSGG